VIEAFTLLGCYALLVSGNRSFGTAYVFGLLDTLWWN
jgi:hypothetical protein